MLGSPPPLSNIALAPKGLTGLTSAFHSKSGGLNTPEGPPQALACLTPRTAWHHLPHSPLRFPCLGVYFWGKLIPDKGRAASGGKGGKVVLTLSLGWGLLG